MGLTSGSSSVKQTGGMGRRLAQILGLLLCLLGWAFVSCTLAMGHWRVAQLGGHGGSSVVQTAWYWSDLWRDCYEDSTALVNCVDFGVLWTVKPYIQAVRGLLLLGLCLGLIGTVLTFFGLECTHIGGDLHTNDRMLITACAFHLLGCLSDMVAYCLYTNRVAAAVLHAKADPSKLSYDIGAAVYLGLVGSFLILLGCTVHCATACKRKHPKSSYPPVSFTGEKGEENEDLRGKKHICRPSKWTSDSRNVSLYKMASVVTV